VPDVIAGLQRAPHYNRRMAETTREKPPTILELIWEHDLVLGG
jgi:hypothetical protein